MLALREETPEAALTRSQRQARAASIPTVGSRSLPHDRSGRPRFASGDSSPHRHGDATTIIVRRQTRSAGNKRHVRHARHRGVEGGRECEVAFRRLGDALEREFAAMIS